MTIVLEAMLWEGLVSAVLETGLERAIDEFEQIFSSVPDEIRRLSASVDLIKLVLKDADQKQIRNAAVRDWLRDLKQVVLDAEDLVDEYATDGALRRSTAGAEARNKITQINKRMGSLARQKERFGLQVLLPSRGYRHLGVAGRPRQTSPVLGDETDVYGREHEKEMVIDLLLSSAGEPESSSTNRTFSVIPLVGMGGVGKTTLARLVFHDEGVRKHFQLMMWVRVSRDFDPKRLTKQMIDAAAAFQGKSEPDQINDWDLRQKKLREEVAGRTFLLVLDDVWTESRSQWEALLEPLNFANRGSRILLTTRSRHAAFCVPGRMSPVVLGGLSEDAAWSLFTRCAFGGSSLEGDAQLQRLGKQIVSRLMGVPLAARMIGCLLNANLDVEHWRKIVESEMWELQRPDEAYIHPAMGLCCRYLPGDLKQCFAYCSLFPYGHEFDKAELAQLWDAQCFSGNRRLGMEDISAMYFEELLRRYFFQQSHNNCYLMHDLIHDLAQYASKGDCFRLEGRSYAGIPYTVRHVSLLVTKIDQAELNELCRQEKLRTLLSLGSCEFDDPTRALDDLFSKLKRLRVLGLRDCGITEVPGSIGDLKHLRHIDLSWNCSLERLPESLGDLYNLQVLKLEGCKSLRALPTRMNELINLRHLGLTCNRCDLFSSIDGLGSLTALEELEVWGRKVRELGGMRMLRELAIRGLEEVRTKEEAIQAGLDSKERLQVLRLEWGYRGGAATSMNPRVEEEVLQALRPVDSIKELEIRHYGGAKSPGWMEDPTTWASFCLQRLVLEGCPNWEVLPSVAQLRFLRSLQIRRLPSNSIRGLDFRFSMLLEQLSIRLA